MKKIIICLFVLVIGFSANAQRFGFQSDWKASVGLNAVGSLGTRSPFNRIDEFAFEFPVMAAIEYQWSEHFAVELDISLNRFKAGKRLDGGKPKESFAYFSTNPTIKWYFTDYIFNNAEDWDLYISGGAGIFYMNEMNSSINLGAGVQYWFSPNVAVRLQSTAKFATSVKGHRYDNNHFQHALLVVFRM